MTESIVGKHIARAQGFVWGRASSQNKQVGVSFRIETGPFAGIELPWYGAMNTEANARRTVQSLRAAGAKLVRWEDLAKCPGLGSCVVQVDVERTQNPATGEWTEKVAWVGSSGVPMKDPLSEAEVLRFAKGFEKLVAESGNGAGGAYEFDPYTGEVHDDRR